MSGGATGVLWDLFESDSLETRMKRRPSEQGSIEVLNKGRRKSRNEFTFRKGLVK